MNLEILVKKNERQKEKYIYSLVYLSFVLHLNLSIKCLDTNNKNGEYLTFEIFEYGLVRLSVLYKKKPPQKRIISDAHYLWENKPFF